MKQPKDYRTVVIWKYSPEIQHLFELIKQLPRYCTSLEDGWITMEKRSFGNWLNRDEVLNTIASVPSVKMQISWRDVAKAIEIQKPNISSQMSMEELVGIARYLNATCEPKDE